MDILSKNQLIEQGKYYTPSQLVTVPANGTATATFQGYNGNKYGLNRFIIGGSSLESIEVTATLLQGVNEPTLFSKVQANCLQQLFLYRSLRGAFIIPEQIRLQLSFTNTSGTDIQINVQLVGYTSLQLDNQLNLYKQKCVDFPKPLLLSANASIAAAADDQLVTVTLPSQKLRMYRMAIRSDSDSNLLVKIRQEDTYIKQQIFISQINDEFNDMDIILPFDINSNVPFQLYFTNLDGANAHEVTFLAETYIV